MWAIGYHIIVLNFRTILRCRKMILKYWVSCCFVLGFWQVTSLSCDTTYSFYDNTNVACSELTTMLFPTVNPNNYVFSALARKYFWNLIEWWQFEKCSTSICILETYGSYRNRNIIRFKYLWNYVLLKLIQGGYEIIS